MRLNCRVAKPMLPLFGAATRHSITGTAGLSRVWCGVAVLQYLRTSLRPLLKPAAMATVTFDTLAFVDILEKAGIAQEQARGIAIAVRGAQDTVLAEYAKTAQEASKRAVDALDSKTEKAIVELKSDIALVRKDMEAMEQRLTIKMGSMFMVAIGILLAALKFMH